MMICIPHIYSIISPTQCPWRRALMWSQASCGPLVFWGGMVVDCEVSLHQASRGMPPLSQPLPLFWLSSLPTTSISLHASHLITFEWPSIGRPPLMTTGCPQEGHLWHLIINIYISPCGICIIHLPSIPNSIIKIPHLMKHLLSISQLVQISLSIYLTSWNISHPYPSHSRSHYQ